MKPECKRDIVYAGALTGVVFIAHHFSEFLEQKVVAGEQYAWLMLFLWYAGFMFVGLKLLRRMKL